jgi:hypothetical protein
LQHSTLISVARLVCALITEAYVDLMKGNGAKFYGSSVEMKKLECLGFTEAKMNHILVFIYGNY